MKISLLEAKSTQITISFDKPREVNREALTVSIFNQDKKRRLLCRYTYDKQNTPKENVGRAWFFQKEFLYERFLRIEATQGDEIDSLIVDQKYINLHHLSNFYDSDELDKIKETGEIPDSLKRGSAELVFSSPSDYFKKNKPATKPFIIALNYGHGQGDVLCAEPTIRKISEALSKKVCVTTKRPEIFLNHPNVDKIFLPEEENYSSPFEKLELFDRLKLSPASSGLIYRWAAGNHVMRYAFAAGFSLRENERTIKYYPYQPERKYRYPHLEDYVVCAVYESSPLRFWSFDKWNKLFRLLGQQGIKVAVIGFTGDNKKRNDLEFFNANHTEELDFSKVLDLTNLSFEDNYHIINESKLLITTDTVPLHIAGATDTWIVTVGCHIAPDVIMPHRHGSQKYKAFYLSGGCTRFCGSDISYSMDPNKFFKNKRHPAAAAIGFDSYASADAECLEAFDKPYCHPEVDAVFEKVKEIYK